MVMVMWCIGIQHGFERNLLRCNWSPDSKHVISASADRVVYVYRVRDSVNVARLPGHQGSVNTVAWHPTEPVVASGSSDKTVFLGELVLEWSRTFFYFLLLLYHCILVSLFLLLLNNRQNVKHSNRLSCISCVSYRRLPVTNPIILVFIQVVGNSLLGSLSTYVNGG